MENSRTIGIVGLGLIGGSLAVDLAQKSRRMDVLDSHVVTRI